jgi:cold shock CspA family protein
VQRSGEKFHNVTGIVEWYNIKMGYGFTRRNDTKETVFVHYSNIAKNNPHKFIPSLENGEVVEFSVISGRGGKPKAVKATGPNGDPAKWIRLCSREVVDVASARTRLVRILAPRRLAVATC